MEINKKFLKKGVFFSFLAITIISLFFLFYFGSPDSNFNKNKSVNTRFDIFNNLITDIHNNQIPRLINTQTKISMIAILEDINTSRTPVSDINSAFKEIMINGTINSNPQDILKQNLTSLLKIIENKSRKLHNIELNFIINDIKINQSNPWLITTTIELITNASYKRMSYYSNESYSSNVSIFNFKDPLYLFEGEINTIKPIDTGVGFRATTPTWNLETLNASINNQTYRHTNRSPSFLMRLENNVSSSVCCGIESFVNSTFGDYNRSYVDFLFFNNFTICNNLEIYNLTNIQNPFKLDNESLEIYNVSNHKIGPNPC